MKRPVVHKACACLVDVQGRLLVFHHPDDRSMQLPKGTVEPGEAPEDAVRRELLEESGIDFQGPLHYLGTLDRECRAGVEGNAFRHAQLWHLYLMRSDAALPDVFDHVAVGSPEEEGLVFSFSWLAHQAEPKGFKKPYLQTIARVREALDAG